MSFLWTTPAWSWPLLLVVAVGAVFLTIRFYDQSRPVPSHGLRRALVILRSTALLLLVLAVGNPILSRILQRDVPAQVVFLLEDSASMSLEGSPGSTNRWQQSLQTVAHVRTAWEERRASVKVRLMRGNGLDDLQEFEWDDPVIPDPLSHGTDLRQLLTKASNRLSADPVRALVLLSDGQETIGCEDWPTSRNQWFGAELILAGVGDPQGSSDRLIKDLRYPETAFQGDRLTVEATIVHRFISPGPNRTVTAWLRDGDQVVAETTVSVGGESTNIELSFVPEEVGLKMLELEVSPLDNERFLSNNRMTLGVDVHKARARVLVLSERPGWNVRFLAQAASRENRLQLEVVYAAENGLVYADSLRQFTVPGTVGQWLDFDAVIMAGYGGVASKLDYSLLSDAVDAGLGLFVLPAPMEAHRRFPLPPGELAKMLPVVLVRQWEQGPLFTRPDSLAFDHPVFSGVVQPPGGNPFAKSAPMAAAVRCTAGHEGTILLRALHHETDESTGVPLLVVRNQGAGRVAFWGGNRLWEMAFWDGVRQGGKSYGLNPMDRIVRNLLVWLADGTSESGLSFAGRRAFYHEGETIRLAAQWRDMRGRPVSDGRINLEVRRLEEKNAHGEIRNFPMDGYDSVRGEYEFHLPAMPPGRYSIQLLGHGEPVVEGPPEELVITSHSVEQTQVRQDARRLKQLAETLAGGYINLHGPTGAQDLAQELEILDLTSRPEQSRRNWDPSSGWPFLLVVVLILALEWFLRRRYGLL